MKSKVKKKKDPDENYDYMKTNKDNIKNIIRDKNNIDLINDIVININKIVIHSYNFLKLYLIYLYENNIDFPTIDKEFICDIFKVITKRKCNSGGYREDNMPNQQKELLNFYNQHYKETIYENEILYYDKMSYILAYEAIDMITNINNNIQEHFIKHLNKYVNLSFDLKGQRNNIDKITKDKLERKEQKKQLYDEFNKIKNDLIICNNKFTSNIKYHEWIIENKKHIIPNKKTFDKNNILYDIKSNTQDYLKSFMYIGIMLEKIYNIEDKNNHMIRLFNVLPLRTNIIPKNIVIDTCGLIQNLLGDEPTAQHLKNYKKDDNQYTLWNKLFKLNKKVFNKNKYSFNFMIRTDAISCSILFIRNDANGKPLKKCPKNITKYEDNMNYIENIEWNETNKNKKIVVADPNLTDLIYCGSKDENNNLETFRYTQNQRRLETRTNKYSKIFDTVNKETIILDKSIKELETILSNLNSKTNNYDDFKKYIIEKNKLNALLYSHYEKEFFRKFKLNRFINTQKSESKMIKNFTNKFGNSKDIIFAIGDYSKGSYNMKGLEPAICKKFRRIFKNAGIETYLINEFRTSKLCNNCHNELEYFMKRNNKFIHGLLCHTDNQHKCEIIHNRDKNAVQNMLYIINSIKNTGKKPDIFCHTTA